MSFLTKLSLFAESFNLKPTTEAHEWSQLFKNGNFDVEDQHSDVRQKVFEVYVNYTKNEPTHHEVCFRGVGILESKLCEIKPREIEQHLFSCHHLLQMRNVFLHRLEHENEKWIQHQKLKHRKPWRWLNEIIPVPRSRSVAD